MSRRSRGACAILGLALAAGALSVGVASADPDGLSAARAGTAGYHDVNAAKADGYGEFRDAAGTACIDKPGVGAMGIHYVRGALVGDPAEQASTPEAVIYAPEKNGQLRLVAVEYVVLKTSWEGAGNAAPPTLFGQQFELVASPNRYGLPPFYELHAWVWKDNPAGMFADYNPRVSCAN